MRIVVQVDFHIGVNEHMAVIFALDRGTVEHRDFKRKIAGLVAYAQGPYQAFLNCDDNLTIAFCTTAGLHRAELMRAWTEATPRQLKAESIGSNFLFSAIDPAVVTPQILCFAPIWATAFWAAPTPLVEL